MFSSCFLLLCVFFTGFFCFHFGVISIFCFHGNRRTKLEQVDPSLEEGEREGGWGGMVRIERGEGRRGGEAGVIRGLKRRGGASNGCGAQPVVVALLP